jgi:hypothetical protein
MFQWNITLSDKQVLMLSAFHAAKPDEKGSLFHAANGMIGDAWDIRAVRKLEEQDLIAVVKTVQETIWRITVKGQLIAQAIMCDAENLRTLRLRQGREMRSLINSDGARRRTERQLSRSKIKR